MSTELATAQRVSPLVTMGAAYGIEPEKLIGVLRNTVIRPTKEGYEARNEEVAAFVMVANQYKLNPWTREIHAFADPQRGLVPIVGIDGWSKLVNDQPRFDGVEFDFVDDEKGNLKAVKCTMYVKDRARPVAVTEYMAECFRPTKPWQQMPRRMLRHKAFMQCARLAFSLSGIHDEDEASDIIKRGAAPSLASKIGKDIQELANQAQSQRQLISEPAAPQAAPPPGKAANRRPGRPPTKQVAPPPEPEPPTEEAPPEADLPFDGGTESQPDDVPPQEEEEQSSIGTAARKADMEKLYSICKQLSDAWTADLCTRFQISQISDARNLESARLSELVESAEAALKKQAAADKEYSIAEIIELGEQVKSGQTQGPLTVRTRAKIDEWSGFDNQGSPVTRVKLFEGNKSIQAWFYAAPPSWVKKQAVTDIRKLELRQYKGDVAYRIIEWEDGF